MKTKTTSKERAAALRTLHKRMVAALACYGRCHEVDMLIDHYFSETEKFRKSLGQPVGGEKWDRRR